MSRVAVVTPTWGSDRHEVLLDRCIPSIQAQTFTDWEHIVVSDGPDPALRTPEHVQYLELPVHVEPHSWGANCRNFGIQETDADLIAFLDSDNAYRPSHLELLVEAIEAGDADFAYSRMHWFERNEDIGADPPSVGQIDSSLIMVRRRSVAAFGLWPVQHRYAIDWLFIAGWLDQGARWAFVPTVTVDYYRS